MGIAHWIDDVAARAPERIALRCAGLQCSYAALARRIEQRAATLHGAGVESGDVVAWLGYNGSAQLAILFACARLGAIFMPLNWRLTACEHRAMLATAKPRLCFVDEPFVAPSRHGDVLPRGTQGIALGGSRPPGWQAWDDFVVGAADLAAPRPSIDPDSPVLLCYTSGSTGQPKGAMLSHAALEANADGSVHMHGLTEQDRVLTTLPLFHVGGLNIQLTPALRAGCSVTLHPKFEPDAWFDAVERDRITLTVAVPAQLEMLLAHPRWATADLSSLRMITTGSTTVRRPLIDAVHARGIPLVQVWGATETGPISAALCADDAHAKAGAVGRAVPGVELLVADGFDQPLPAGQFGEVLVRGRNLMRGYFGDARATEQALRGGWFHSGDGGHLDDEGYLWIDGRLKDMIISGGENVSPAEVEGVLLECPQVAEAAVVGRPDERWGEAVIAVVVAQPGARLDGGELLRSFQGRLARFKHPKEILVVDALPRTALGKVRKDDVRKMVVALTPDAATGVSS
jgi:fatty-acyl-CoA synthase